MCLAAARDLVWTLLCCTVLMALNASGASGSESSSKQTPLERAFKAQIMLDMAVSVVTSERANDNLAWAQNTRWSNPHRAHSLFALVHLSPELLNVAVEYWAEGRRSITASDKDAARSKLAKRFLQPGKRSFLLIVKPIAEAYDSDDWCIGFGPVSENVSVVSLDGEMGRVTRSEKTLDGWLYATSGVKSCFFCTEDPVSEQTDPTFNVKISGIVHYVQEAYGSKRSWLKAKNAMTTYFRFETSRVKLLSMLEEGVPWDTIERKYLEPRRQVTSAGSSGSGLAFMNNVAASLVAGIILKIL